MSAVSADLKYAKTHEWARTMDDGTVLVGISDHAQEALGDLVFVELPEVGTTLVAGDECAVVESVKAASDIYSPVSGDVIEVNEVLTDRPEIINEDAYGDGWLFRLEPSDPDELDALLAAEAYAQVAEADVH